MNPQYYQQSNMNDYNNDYDNSSSDYTEESDDDDR